MPREAGSDYYLVALMYPRDSRLRSEDGSRRSSAARFALLALPAAVAGAPAFVVVSVVAPAAYSPADSAPHSSAVLARTTAPPAPRSFPAPSAIPRIGVSLSFSLHLLSLIRVDRFVRLHRLRQVAQRRKIRNHIIIFQHRHILVDLVDVSGTQRIVLRPRPNPHHGQQQHRSRKRHTRRRREPCPPALPRWFRRHARMHAQIKRCRWLDHRQFVQQSMHRAKFIHAQLAGRARQEMFLHLQPFAFLQAAVHESHNLVFHPATTHDFLPFWPNLCYFPCCATRGASSTRSVSYARNSSDFSALSEHSKIFEISP